jgi:DNA-binding transcriptional LysR family regulator
MRFSLRQIEVMCAVMRTGSVMDAARFLGVSQPSISTTLKQCAEVARFPLFRRIQGRLVATAEAMALLPELDRILNSVGQLDALADDLRAGSAGNVRVLATPAIAASILPAAIREFGDLHPAVTVTVDIRLSAEVVSEVSAGGADLGLVMSPGKMRGVTAVDIWEGALVCVVPSEHPLAMLKAATPEALSKYRLISFNRSLPLGTLVDDAFRSCGVARRIAIEIGPSAFACALVAAGAGCAVVDSFSVTHHANWPVTVIPFEPHTRVTAQLVTHGERPLSRAAMAFTASLRRTAQQIEKAMPKTT